MKIAVSYLGVRNIPNTLSRLDKTDADFIHVDVMDGKYVKNKTPSYREISSIGIYTKKRLDVHFMVLHPLKYIDDYANLNVSYMSFHLDIKDDINKVIDKIKSYGIKVGIAINPNEDISVVYPYLEKIDMVLIMTVVPGLSGQKLLNDVIPKIHVLKKQIIDENQNIIISVDGGINLETKKLVKNADLLVSGSCVIKENNYQEVITKLRVLDD